MGSLKSYSIRWIAWGLFLSFPTYAFHSESRLCRLTALLADPSPVFSAKLNEIVESRYFKHYQGEKATRPIRESLRDLHRYELRFKGPFEFVADISERDDILAIYVRYLGPPRPFFSFLGSSPQVRHGILARAITALIEGVEARKETNPQLRRIVIESSNTAQHLVEMLKPMGFQIVRPACYGSVSFGAWVRLAIDLEH